MNELKDGCMKGSDVASGTPTRWPLTSLNLGYPVPQCSGHLPMIKAITENLQPRQRL